MKKLLFFLATIPFLFSCHRSEKTPEKQFRRLTSEASKIHFTNTLTENDSLNYFSYGYMYMGGGLSAGDINNDGLIDLYFTGNMVPNKLYLNKGNLEFEDISESAGVAGDGRWFTGVTMADINADGLLDIYCSVSGKYGDKSNLLYVNNGDLTFTESAKEYGLADRGNSIQSTFFDYDQDGDLDLYVANYPPTNFDTPNGYYAFKMQNAKDEETDHLYRNDGNSFTDVTDEAKLRSFGLTNSVTIGDLNSDGYPDIYVSNDFSVPDFLFLNNQNGTFSEVVQKATQQTSLYGMGVDIADFNNDAMLDIFQMDMTPEDNRRSKANMAGMNPDLFWGTVNAGFGYQYMINMLQINNGNINDTLPSFSNVSRIAGVSTTDWSWGPLIMDLDNDGWKDIFVSNGTRREINNKDYFHDLKSEKYSKEDFLEKSLAIPSEKIDNFVYRNNGDLTFQKMNEDWGMIYEGWSNGCAYADLDNDGDLEIIINNVDDEAVIFENFNIDKNNYVAFNFKGPEKNKLGIGVKVYVRSDGLEQFQELTLTRGFQSSVAPRLHFGVGGAKVVSEIKVIWPDQKEEILRDIASNQLIEIDYRNSTGPVSKQLLTDHSKLFSTEKDTSIVGVQKHRENLFDDFKDQVLLPHRTSSFGPGISVADLNGDGLEDFVLAGASNYETEIYFKTDRGFVKRNSPDMVKDLLYEDLSSVIFDADGDGDNDIYMVSGGNEFPQGSDYYQDRLYMNDGKGVFKKSDTALPVMLTSGGRAASFDFDQDGDLDLFVGGRLLPKNYPLPPDSYLLENVSTKDHPKFIDVSAQKAPMLKELGMITGISWADIDKDGWTDLVLTGEWMPITVLKNDQGSFRNITKELGLLDSTGWWFSIKAEDIDKDGDLDFIAGNLGLNYKYQAKEDETFDIYVNDFDKNNSNDIVLSYYNHGEKFPVRGRQCSSQQIPTIQQKFKNYEEFSKATLADVYTEKSLNESLHYQAKTFASAYIENREGEFIIHKLPNEAQFSSVNQVLIHDFDGDANVDVVIAGNLYGSEVETPRNDASIGLFLKGKGDGTFEVIPGYLSGLYLPGDIKDMSLISVNDELYIVAAKNDDYVQWVRVH